MKQEVYAHFTLVALSRLFATECERELAAVAAQPGRPPQRANFNHSLGTVARELEGLFLNHAALLRETLDRVLAHVARSGSGRTAPTRAGPSGHPRNGGIASQPTPTPQTDLRLPLGRLKRMRFHP